MNDVLFKSQNMNWCTPQDFFDELNKEFHFVLDAAATEKSAKCKKFFTPKTNGLTSSWDAGGGLCSAIRRMVDKLDFGLKKHMKNL